MHHSILSPPTFQHHTSTTSYYLSYQATVTLARSTFTMASLPLTEDPVTKKKVVVCGAGIVGASIAYYLSRLGNPCIIIERTGIAAAASGKAGGFLGQSWNDGTPVEQLSRRSYDLHRELATQQLKAYDYGYRALDTFEIKGDMVASMLAALTTRKRRTRSAASATEAAATNNSNSNPNDNACDSSSSSSDAPPPAADDDSMSMSLLPSWLDANNITAVKALGSTADTAQVSPALLTDALIKEAVSLGCEFRLGTVERVVTIDVDQVDAAAAAESLSSSSNNDDTDNAADASPLTMSPRAIPGTTVLHRVTGVMVDGSLVEADVVVVAAGPWSNMFQDSFPILSRVTGSKANSIVLRPPASANITAHAIFFDFKDQAGQHVTPEIYPRPNGDVYCCGNVEPNAVLPDSAADIEPSPDKIAELKQIIDHVSPALAACDIQVQQACFLPSHASGMPLIGQLPHTSGAFVATGHTCWGILNGPATGEALAELIVCGKTTHVDLAPFDPCRVTTF
jgi:glycine/D-amino acid oxidase-like deaminating enzyme